ncbi:MAG: carbohydrate ABC transporter permease [Planctomycetota bacterium]
MNRSGALRLVPVYTLLLLAAGLTLLPLLWMVLASFKNNEDFMGSVFVPRDSDGNIALGRFTLEHYRTLGGRENFLRPLINSAFLASVTAIGATLVCAAGGYALAKYNFKGRKLCTGLVLGAMLVPGPLLLAPGYQVLHTVGLLDTFYGLILPALAPAFGVFLFRQAAMVSVPTELIEAARIDGCGEGRTFFTIAMPLLRPMIGTFLMITFLGVWNNFISPQVVLQDSDKFPLSVAVAQLRGTYYQDYGLQMAGTLVSIVPVFLLFLPLQRDFVSGMTSGAVKG